MAYDKGQFQAFIEKTLTDIGMNSPAAVNLILGTAAQESAFGTFLIQEGGGPGRGPFQMEAETFNWLREKFSQKPWGFSIRKCDDLVYDLRLAIITCRVRYYVVPEPLPEADDLPGLAAYWKIHYNCGGKGTEAEFISNYHRYVG